MRARSDGGAAQPLLVLDDVTLRIRDHKLLAHTSWTIRRGEQWAVLGPNGSGKSTLARTISGELPSAAGHVRLDESERVALVSFEAQADLYAREVELDDARHFSGRTDSLLTPRRLLALDSEAAGGEGTEAPRRAARSSAAAAHDDGIAGAAGHADGPVALDGSAHALSLGSLLDRPFRHLSAGEMRKTLILRALMRDPTLLVLDEPFDGLDARSRESLARYLESLMAGGRHIILVTHRADEIPLGITHVLSLRAGAVVGMGERQAMLDPARLEELYGSDFRPPAPARRARATAPKGGGEPLVEFKGVTVRFGELVVLRDLTWRLRSGERWAIVGPNGSGKTTILNLIVGENLQGYANDIRLFGRRKGTGESVWEVRQRIGLVTPHLQLGYRKAVTGLEVVLSGLFDSIGLYRRPSAAELAAAHRWLERLELLELAERHFNRLSYGQRRLLLIARAMVKEPRLLILDEPCQGLDPRNRRKVLSAIDAASSGETSLLYVTHLGDEHPGCLTHILHLSGAGEPARVEIL